MPGDPTIAPSAYASAVSCGQPQASPLPHGCASSPIRTDRVAMVVTTSSIFSSRNLQYCQLCLPFLSSNSKTSVFWASGRGPRGMKMPSLHLNSWRPFANPQRGGFASIGLSLLGRLFEVLVSYDFARLKRSSNCADTCSQGSSGILDLWLRCSAGDNHLDGYVVMCIGGTRVLVWKGETLQTKWSYKRVGST